MMSLRCPHDGQPLASTRRGSLRSFSCPSCGGQALNLATLRHLSSPETARQAWRQALNQGRAEGPPCPSCARALVVVPREGARPELDLCRSCQILWLDPGELEALAPGAEAARPDRRVLDPAPAPTPAVKGRPRVDEGRDGPPDDPLRAALAHLGVPFEEGLPERVWPPLLTWSFTGLTVLAFLGSLGGMEQAVATWGFVPAEAQRTLGLTSLSGTLLHEDPVHLLFDLYLWTIYADNVEDALGPLAFFALVVAASAAGAVAHAWLDPFPQLALVGSTAAGAACLAFYALRFPDARVGFIWRDRARWLGGTISWVRVPARINAGIVGAFLLGLAVMQVQGEGWISGVSGVTGGVVGWVAFHLDGLRRWRV